MRFPVTALTAVLVLCLATAAQAKEIEAVAICGASGCEDVDDIQAFIAGGGLGAGDPEQQPAQPMQAVQPYLRVDVDISAPPEENIEGWSVFVAADGSLIRSQGPGVGGGQTWMALPVQAGRIIRRAAARIEPFPAPTLSDVRIGSHRASEPAAYSDLFGLEAAPRPTTVSPGGWERIHVRSTVPSPWTDGGDRIDWSPSLGLIRVDGLYLEPTPALSERLRADTSRAASPDDDGPGFIPWLSALVALGTAAALFLVRRRRPGPATA